MKKNDLRFFYLLLLLFASLVIFPFVHQFIISAIMMKVLFSIIMIGCLYALTSFRLVFFIGLGLCVLSLIFEWSLYLYPKVGFLIAADIFSLLLLALVMASIFHRIFFVDKVTIDMVFGASCIYIFLGIAWATIYSLLEVFIPGSFSGIMSEEAGYGIVQSLSENLIYYSFVTLTTLGYGDITPISSPAKFLSVLEAISGQLYLAVAIARSVGMYLSERKGIS